MTMRERWRGRSWATLGDSITAANGYQPLVAEALAFGRVGNYGRSGCPMTAGSDRDEGATVYMGDRLEGAYDCVTIFAGTNDYRLGLPLGELRPVGRAPYDIRTFCGAYQKLVEGLLSRVYRALVPGGRLVFSVEHPLLTAPSRPGWQTETDGRKTWPVDSYLVEGPRQTNWLAEGVIKQHRTTATYLNLLLRLGFTLHHLEEWGPSDAQVAANPSLAEERQRPTFMLVSASR